MDITIALEHRFWRTPDGSYWSATVYPRHYWSRYLGVFDGVKLLARAYHVPAKHDSWTRVDGDGVSIVPLPAYVGPWGFLRNFAGVYQTIRKAALGDSAILLRVPATIGTVVSWCLEPGRPYGIEVLQDPYLFFSRRAVSHPLRIFFRWWFSQTMKVQCRKAACSLYVTERALQQRYPPQAAPIAKRFGPRLLRDQLSVSASDVELQNVAFVDSAHEAIKVRSLVSTRGGSDERRRFRLIFVGTLERLHKGPDVLVAAFARPGW